MNPLLNIKEIFFICCILSCCFLTNLAVEVTSENVEEYFKFEFGKADPRLNLIRSTSKQITKISVDAFNNTSNCGRFEISHCKELSTIPEYLFQERRVFQNVDIVIFSSTGITNFPALLFLDLQLIRYVMIYNSKVETFHEEFFQSNTNLRYLDISGNKLLKRLPPGLLKYNRILQEIEIWGNQLLEHLPPQLFQNLLLPEGIIFQLQGNGLKFIEYETFANIDFLKVKQLDLSNNYLVCLPDYFLNETIIPEQIRNKINLTGNCFDETSQICQKYECQNRVANECENARSSTNVRSCQEGFSVTVNNEDEQRGIVTSANVEKYFEFYNNITTDAEDRRMEFDRNLLYMKPWQNITRISVDAFKNYQDCRRFEISHCKELSTIPENVFQNKRVFENVRQIGFSGTGITHFSKKLFRDLLQLFHVMLHDNKMKSLPTNLFQSNTKLYKLDISGNKLLKRLPPGLLRDNKELNDIKIRNNKLLETIPSQIFKNLLQQNQIKFELQGNGLKYIQHETFSNIDFSKVYHFNISNNYLVCLPDYFLNVKRIPANRRSKINLTGNCFDESSRICQLYECRNRAANECEKARNSTNVRSCQEGFSVTVNNEDEAESEADSGNEVRE